MKGHPIYKFVIFQSQQIYQKVQGLHIVSLLDDLVFNYLKNSSIEYKKIVAQSIISPAITSP